MDTGNCGGRHRIPTTLIDELRKAATAFDTTAPPTGADGPDLAPIHDEVHRLRKTAALCSMAARRLVEMEDLLADKTLRTLTPEQFRAIRRFLNDLLSDEPGRRGEA